MRENRNIYQSARELKGLTQEVAAERLDLSVESLGAYEQDRRRPPDSTVLRMAQLYDFPYLCYQHIQSGDLAGVMPEVNVKSLEHAAMRIVRLIGGFARNGQFDQLLQICEDGVIAEEERPVRLHYVRTGRDRVCGIGADICIERSRKVKSRQRKSACTAATVASANSKTSYDYYTTAAVKRQVPDFEVLDGGCQGVRPRMIGIGFALLLLTAGLTDNGTLPLWGTVLTGVVGLALLMGGVRNA